MSASERASCTHTINRPFGGGGGDCAATTLKSRRCTTRCIAIAALQGEAASAAAAVNLVSNRDPYGGKLPKKATFISSFFPVADIQRVDAWIA